MVSFSFLKLVTLNSHGVSINQSTSYNTLVISEGSYQLKVLLMEFMINKTNTSRMRQCISGPIHWTAHRRLLLPMQQSMLISDTSITQAEFIITATIGC